MKINVDRLATLAGIEYSQNTLREGKSLKDDEQLPKDDSAEDAAESDLDMDEEIEIDERVLVQELRRAKRMLSESKKNQENLQEVELKKIISSEINNVLRDLNLNSGWIYGNNKPKRSKKGYSHQGSFLKGLGFK
jgi:hypothetical protein